MQQLSLFGVARRPVYYEPVDPDGTVISGVPDVILRLPHPRLAWDLAAIRLHRHEDGRWMWAIQHMNGGYKVGPKWGRFADTQVVALECAASELLDWCDRQHGRTGGQIEARQVEKIRIWAEGLL